MAALQVVASLTGGGNAEDVKQQLAAALPGLKRLSGVSVGGGSGGNGSGEAGALAESGTAVAAADADPPAGSS